jgi:hypothetical protein
LIALRDQPGVRKFTLRRWLLEIAQQHRARA